MGSSNLRPDRIVFPVSAENQEVFEQANILRIVLGESKEQFFRRLALAELLTKHAKEKLSRNWVRWNELVDHMQKAGFNINRTTFWQYRQRVAFQALIATDGTDVLYDADGIEAYFRS